METRGIAEGMTVRAEDGRKLGKVIECAADHFVVEKGLFFPKDYAVRYEQVAEIKDGEICLDVSGLDVAGAPAESRPAQAKDQEWARAQPTPGPAMAESREEVRVPLAAEELEVEKRARDAGEVRVHKEVVAETRTVNVPVTREEVHVERVPAAGTEAPGEAAFREGTVAVPVREEEVEIRKRPVVKEEVRVNRTRQQEERRAEAEVRHEEARIEGQQGEVARGDGEGTGEDLPRALDEPER